MKTHEQHVKEITSKITARFRCFGGGRTEGNPIAAALADKPPMFVAGVDVAEVVSFVLTEAARENN
jgi:hypothetical protein